jgi:hypothetical protein
MGGIFVILILTTLSIVVIIILLIIVILTPINKNIVSTSTSNEVYAKVMENAFF